MSCSTRYLGVIINEDLNWKNQVQQVCNGLKSIFSTFYNVRQYLSTVEIKTIYYALVYSRIKYGLVVYGTALHTFVNPIQNNLSLASLSISKDMLFGSNEDPFSSAISYIFPCARFVSQFCLG